MATVEPVFLYGAETWTLIKNPEKQIDGTYKKLLLMVLNISWKNHTTNTHLYQDLPNVTAKIKQRMMLAGHCFKNPEKVAHKLVFCQSTKGKRNRGRRKMTYVDVLLKDTETESINELSRIMKDRENWRKRVNAVRTEG